jgi:predicted lipid-binding transport protein (Tim44 family)
MDSTYLIIAVVFGLLIAGILVFLLIKQRKEMKALESAQPKQTTPPPAAGDASTRQLQLQAYERLILLTDRIALPNLIARVNTPGLSARDMQSLLIHSIRQEFEHNITQQIYVSNEAWGVVRDYKEQNQLIVNQVASFLPEEASGADLNRALLDMLVQNPKASLQNVVSEALSFEAKKAM